jgi:hypothetical protein
VAAAAAAAGALFARVRVVGDFLLMNLLKGDRGDLADAALAAEVSDTAEEEVAGAAPTAEAVADELDGGAVSAGDRSDAGGLLASSCEKSGSVKGSGAALRPMLTDDVVAVDVSGCGKSWAVPEAIVAAGAAAGVKGLRIGPWPSAGVLSRAVEGLGSLNSLKIRCNNLIKSCQRWSNMSSGSGTRQRHNQGGPLSACL